MKSSLKGKQISINIWRSEYIIIQNMFMNTRTEREEKEREGRTECHIGDTTGYNPLGDIFIKGLLVVEH